MKRYIRSTVTNYTLEEIKQSLRQDPHYKKYLLDDEALEAQANALYKMQLRQQLRADDTSDNLSNFTIDDIKDWLLARKDRACTLTDEQLDEMASQCYQYAKDEEAYSGEPYADVDEIDLGELLDAADGELYDMWQNLNGWDVEE